MKCQSPSEAKQKHLTPPNAIQYLKNEHGIEHTVGTLAVWRCQGRGPRAYRLHGKIYYRDKDLDHFVATAKYSETIDSRIECT